MLDEAKLAGDRTDSLCLFTKYDQFGLERALGEENAFEMLTGQKSAYLFS